MISVLHLPERHALSLVVLIVLVRLVRAGGINWQPLLQEYQMVQRKRLRAAVGAVVAANRLQKVLAAGRKDRLDEAAKSHGGQLPEINGVAAALPQDEAGATSQGEEKM